MSANNSQVGIWGVLKESWRVFFARPWLFVGIAALPALIDVASNLLGQKSSWDSNPANLPTAYLEMQAVGSFLLTLIWSIVELLAACAICFAAARICLSERISAREAMWYASARASRLVGIALYQFLYALVPCLFAFIVVFAVVGSQMQSEWLVALIVSIAFVPILVILSRYLLATSVCAVEDVSASRCIERSVSLGRNHRWTFFWFLAFPMAVFGVIDWAYLQRAMPWLERFSFFFHFPILLSVTKSVPLVLGAFVALSWLSILYTLLYFKLLAIQEGISLDDVRNGALAARKQAAIGAEDGEPGPWDRVGDPAMHVSSESVGIPWSVLAARGSVHGIRDSLDAADSEHTKTSEKHTGTRSDDTL